MCFTHSFVYLTIYTYFNSSTLYTLNLHNIMCQLYLNKALGKKIYWKLFLPKLGYLLGLLYLMRWYM